MEVMQSYFQQTYCLNSYKPTLFKRGEGSRRTCLLKQTMTNNLGAIFNITTNGYFPYLHFIGHQFRIQKDVILSLFTRT